MKEKKCSKCGRVLPLGEFRKDKSKKDGLQGQCKQCVAERQRKYNEANKEKIAESVRKYREANKGKVKEWHRKYRAANKEKIAEQGRKYREANKEKIAEYREANKEKIKEGQRKHYEANKEKIKEGQRKHYEANKEKFREYREANKEKIAEQWRKYYEANKGKLAEKDRKYYEANKDKVNERARKRMRERRKNDPEYRAMLTIRKQMRRVDKMGKPSLKIYGVLNRELAIKIDREKLKIYDKYFKGVKKHLDHMRPLGEVKHSVEEMHKRSHFTNLVYIPAEANLSKGATPFWEWFARLKDEKLEKCIAEQDAYNKKIQRQLDANT